MTLYVLSTILGIAALLLVILAVIDLRVRLLPNIYVFPFAILGVIFHIVSGFNILSPENMLVGGLIGYGLLWIIRFFANRHYGKDSLGLGDVKLMGAAGLWLGIDGILFALTIGAFAGVLHGLAYAVWQGIRTKSRPSVNQLMIPAGPGFIVGIAAVAVWLFMPYFLELRYGFGL